MLRKKEKKGRSNRSKAATRSSVKPKKNRKVSDAESSEDDAPPQAVTFTESREKMMEKKRKVIEQLELEKQRLKAKRRHQEETYKEQKKNKLARLDQCRLPEEILEKLDVVNKIAPTDGSNSQPSVVPSTEEEMESLGEESDENVSNSTDKEEEYIQFKTNPIDNIKAVYIGQKLEKNDACQKALNFKNQHFFGSHAKRHTMSSYKSDLEKRRQRYPKKRQSN
jgi:hypothetical protein